MSIEKQPFTSYTLEEDKNKDDKTFTTRLTPNDKIWFLPAKKFIKQEKNSTAMKQLAKIGAVVVLHDKKMAAILDIVLGNKRRNDRIGIVDDVENLQEKFANVT